MSARFANSSTNWPTVAELTIGITSEGAAFLALPCPAAASTLTLTRQRTCVRGGLFRGEMKDSRAWEVDLQQVDGRALEQIVDFAYTGKIELAGSTVVAIIQAANVPRE